MSINITALFVCLDDFCKTYEEWERHCLIPTSRKRRRPGKLALSEMLFIMVLFHLEAFRNFKTFYLYGICLKHRSCFNELPHYDRFVALMPRLFMPLTILLHCLSGEETGIYFVDATPLKVCRNKRIGRHKTFEGLAARGKTTMGWFFGLKLHVLINHKGEIMAVKITPGNVDDRVPLEGLLKQLNGKVFGDKGYIDRKLFKRLWNNGIHLVTGIRRNMKNYLMPWLNKCLLRKRFIIETVFGVLKKDMGLEHTRHRSPVNAMVHILSCLAAYSMKPGKPHIRMPTLFLRAYP